MSVSIQLKRGSTARHTTFTGLEGEVTVDTSKSTAVVHDGITPGGHPLAKEARKIQGDGTVVKVNGGASATLASDITVSVDSGEITKSVVNTLKTDTTTMQSLAGDLVSTKSGNSLTKADTDGKLYVNVPSVDPTGLVSATDKVISVDGSQKITSTLTMEFTPTTGKLAIKGVSGQEVSSATIQHGDPILKQSPQIVVNPSGQPNGTYIQLDWNVTGGGTATTYLDVSQLVDAYTAGSGIDVSSVNAISVKTASTEAVYVTPAGNLGVKVGTGLKITPGLTSNDPGQIDLDMSTAGSTGLISSDAGNRLTTGTDNKLLVKDYGAEQGVQLVGDKFSAAIAKTGNLITLVSGELFAPTDFGTV